MSAEGFNVIAQELGAALGSGYSVVRALGEGGFAVVLLVRDLSLKRDLAVKVLSPDMITSKTVLDRFRREAEMIAQLAHPNIVPLYFIGERGDLVYLAMQCVSGGSIADRLAREGTMPVADVIRVITEVASALAHAHKRGIIHRDIKPANILVDAESGRCLVTDFGIARSAIASQVAQLTATGVMLGTPAYLSPEQVTGEPIDHRVDIYALGIMAHEMLTGRVPFEAPTATAAMMKRLAGPPEPVTTIRADVPKHVATAITTCLAANPAERLQSMEDVIAAFSGEHAIAPVASTASKNVERSGSPRRALVIAAGTALIALVGGAAWFASRRTATKDSNAAVMPPPASSITTDSDLVAIAAGEYVIGSDDGPPASRPRHSVHVDAFRIGRTEVTVGAYEKFLIATQAPSPWPSGTKPDARLPVTRVPWGDAANYCAWKYPNGGRLPSEIEWEAAARGAAGRQFPYGDTALPASANTASARRSGPSPVGSFPRGSTPDGIDDMSGNVWEWTSSRMEAYPGGPALSPELSKNRVIRGGAFDTDDTIATTWHRGYFPESAASSELPNTGFRCAASAR